MKVPLLIEEETKAVDEISFLERRIILPLTITGRGMVKTSLIIDTGSPFSLMSYPTFLRLNLPKGKLVLKDIVIANVTVNLFSVPNLKLYMKSEEKVVSIATSALGVALPSEKEKNKQKVYELPNIAGLDFLDFHALKLFVDVKNKNCYLEL